MKVQEYYARANLKSGAIFLELEDQQGKVLLVDRLGTKRWLSADRFGEAKMLPARCFTIEQLSAFDRREQVQDAKAEELVRTAEAKRAIFSRLIANEGVTYLKLSHWCDGADGLKSEKKFLYWLGAKLRDDAAVSDEEVAKGREIIKRAIDLGFDETAKNAWEK